MDKDKVEFFFADIGETQILSASGTSAPLPLPLKDGRYLVHVPTQSDDTALVWVCAGAFVAGTPLVATAAAGLQRMALASRTATTIEFNVRKNYNDALAVITSAGTASVHVTKVSR